jgi:hypothetical protein
VLHCDEECFIAMEPQEAVIPAEFARARAGALVAGNGGPSGQAGRGTEIQKWTNGPSKPDKENRRHC